MPMHSDKTTFFSEPPGPALKIEDAGAREAWATMEQLLLVIDSFINDVTCLDQHTIEASSHGLSPKHDLPTGTNAQTAAPGRMAC
jgi:hypothetical protein